ncbi:cytochrome b562 [Caballeronia glebae]|uniref:cytochrome b562 n=1 Tax=Caballeronia glebae TaxID=1777143 RepID=UPI0038BCB793
MSKKPLYMSLRTLLCASLIAAASSSHAGEIKTLMKDMKRAMQGAMASTTMPELSGYVARFESDTQLASRQPYHGDQHTYDEGMQALRQKLAEVDREIQAKNLSAAKRALLQINGMKKHYHDLLS